MEHQSPHTPGPADEQVTTVTTSNFLQVLEHFDQEGHIINENTRFDIQCNVCYGKNLAVINPIFDKKSRDTHESYAVLPMCGHAFGYTCLFNWLKRDFNLDNPTCPICRQPVYPSTEPIIFNIFGGAGVEEQHLEIVDVRKSLFYNDILEERGAQPSAEAIEQQFQNYDQITRDMLELARLQHLRQLRAARRVLTAAYEQMIRPDRDPSELENLERLLMRNEESALAQGDDSAVTMQLTLSDLDEDLAPILEISDFSDTVSERYETEIETETENDMEE
ncbi:hypothetical protein F5Y13DRAFT_203971 [Hypoxylon sp. FL1857]|nr:hypothetical protein F5Y13DRAFT_203971 [Hypoxylon sp. FL1857]